MINEQNSYYKFRINPPHHEARATSSMYIYFFLKKTELNNHKITLQGNLIIFTCDFILNKY